MRKKSVKTPKKQLNNLPKYDKLMKMLKKLISEIDFMIKANKQQDDKMKDKMKAKKKKKC